MRSVPRSVTLRVIDDENMEAVTALRVRPDQEKFVDGVADSLREAAANPAARPWARAVYAGDVPVGFLMAADAAEPGNGVVPWPYYLWRMLIDARLQGQGYGRAALDLLVTHLRERSDADVLTTSVVPGAGSPYGFYVRYGFRPTGEWFDHEQVLTLPIARDR
jgi:diamine N-acetyltransferase